MNKLLVTGFLGILLISCIAVYSDIGDEEVTEETYQGPVPLGYDTEHFRKTGETIMEVSS